MLAHGMRWLMIVDIDMDIRTCEVEATCLSLQDNTMNIIAETLECKVILQTLWLLSSKHPHASPQAALRTMIFVQEPEIHLRGWRESDLLKSPS